MITPCRDEEAFRQLVRDSATQPIFLFKHSTRCPISARANQAFTQFAAEMPDVACRQVLVVEQRPLSQLIAQETGVAHQSPQVLLFHDGKVAWHASHGSITVETLRKALEGVPRA